MKEKQYVAEFVEAEDAPAPRPSGPQIQRRERWVELPSEYPGFKFRMWLNAPTKLWTALTAEPHIPKDATEEQIAEIKAASEAEKQEALGKIVLEHNGWLDEEGEPYPPASTPASFWKEIPQELATIILVACQVEMGKLPNSLIPRRRH